MTDIVELVFISAATGFGAIAGQTVFKFWIEPHVKRIDMTIKRNIPKHRQINYQSKVDQIYETLLKCGEEVISPSKCAELSGISSQQACFYLGEFVKNGKIIKVRHGIYRIIRQEKPD